jgi:hypothetical protein
MFGGLASSVDEAARKSRWWRCQCGERATEEAAASATGMGLVQFEVRRPESDLKFLLDLS